jgi:serine protease Do
MNLHTDDGNEPCAHPLLDRIGWLKEDARVRIPVLTVLAIVCAATLAGAQPVQRAEIDRAIAAVYPSLVRISVVTTEHSNGREIRREGSGSGTIITPDGYVVTNHHVAGRAQRIVCTLFDKQELPADLVGTDPVSDIAVLKLRPPSPRTFPVAAFGDSSTLVRGDPVLALGSPLALSQSVTLGIVSNTEMIMPRTMSRGLSLDGEDVGTIVRWIGHDAAIYPGNSGGPLVNLKGEIVGINEISFGLAGAIPAALARTVAEALMKDGAVRRSWTGVELQPTLGGEKRPGALVAWVADGSPAAKAGVESGDLLVQINDTPIDVKFAEQLPLVNQVLAGLPIGQPARVTLTRPSGPIVVSLRPTERSAALATPSELREWGMVGADVTPTQAREMARPSTDGVRVDSMRSGGAAEQAKPALRVDDVIVELEGKPVRSVSDLESATRTLLDKTPRASVLVAFDRGDERRLAILELSRPRTESGGVEARKASLPVTVQVLTPVLADRLGLKGRTGVRITHVSDASVPLRVGDIVLAIDGAAVRATASTDEEVFAAALRQYAVGSKVTLTVHRGGAEMPVEATLRAAARQAREMKRYEDVDFGFRARELADSDLEDPRLRGTSQGIVVDAIEQGGWAALARLYTGDVILSVDGQPVADVDALMAQLKAAVDRKRTSVVFKVRRGVRTLFIELEPAWPL